MESSITSLPPFPGGPTVIQCRCKAVLSDSTEFACTMTAPDGVKFVCVRGVTDARVDRIATTTTAPHAVHYAVCCDACGAAVGRLYTAAPPQLAPALNLFCLDVSRCLSYELGSAEVRAPGDAAAAATAAAQQQQRGGAGAGQQPQPQPQHQHQQQGGPPGVDASLVLDLLQRIEHLEASLCTLQGMQVLHDSQLRGLPGYQGDAAAAGGG